MTNDVKLNRRSRGPSLIRQRDVRRLVSAAQAAGLSVSGIEWKPDGTLRLLTGNNDNIRSETDPLDQWMADHARATEGD